MRLLALLVLAGLLPAQITITATASRQPPDTLRAVFGRLPKSLALEEVLVCATAPVQVSTAQVRRSLAGDGLVLLSPVLGVVTAEAEHSRGGQWAELGRELAPGGSLALAVSNLNPYARGLSMLGASILSSFGRRKGIPVALGDPGHLEVGPGCVSYPTLARFRRNAPEVVTVEVR